MQTYTPHSTGRRGEQRCLGREGEWIPKRQATQFRSTSHKARNKCNDGSASPK